jgi:hypothetical protein
MKLKTLFVLLLTSISIIAQPKKDIKVSIDVYLDNKKIECDSIYVSIINSTYTTNPMMCRITDSFTTWVSSNEVCNFIITRPGYNKQYFTLNTHQTKKGLSMKVYLTKGDPDCYIGYLKYNSFLKTYANHSY